MLYYELDGDVEVKQGGPGSVSQRRSMRPRAERGAARAVE
jgi:hypothetical protein